MFDKPFEEYAVGETWTSLRGRTITEADVVQFAALSGDWYPLHTDKVWAERSPFGQRIAHGMLVLSASIGLIPMKPGVVIAFYGIDNLRFVAPTFIGDTIYVENEVIDKKEKEKGGVVTVRSATKKQTGETVIVSTLHVLVSKRGSDCP